MSPREDEEEIDARSGTHEEAEDDEEEPPSGWLPREKTVLRLGHEEALDPRTPSGFATATGPG